MINTPSIKMKRAMLAARRASEAPRESSFNSQEDSVTSTVSCTSNDSRPQGASTRVRSSIVSLVTKSRTSTILALGAARSALDSLSNMVKGIVRKSRLAKEKDDDDDCSAKRRDHNRRGAFFTDPCETLATRFDLPLQEVQAISEHMAALRVEASYEDEVMLDAPYFSRFLGAVFSIEVADLDPLFLGCARGHFEAYSEVRLDDFLNWYSWYWEQYREHKEEVTQIADTFAESAIMLTSLKIMFDRACSTKPISKNGTLNRKKCRDIMLKLSEYIETGGMCHAQESPTSSWRFSIEAEMDVVTLEQLAFWYMEKKLSLKP